MQRYLARVALDAATRAELQARLGAVPWCWPRRETAALRERALELVPGGPPELAIGVVPLLTVGRRDDVAWLSVLLPVPSVGTPVPTASAPLPEVSLDRVAQEAWDDAVTALSRSLPLLWQSLASATEQPRSALAIVPRASCRVTVRPPGEIGGPSLGLSFLLAMVSRLLGKPLPRDVAASAAVGPEGSVRGVCGLEAKIALLDDEAPGIERLIVAAENAPEAEGYARRVRIVPVTSAGHAVREVFGHDLEQYLVNAGRDAEARAELVRSFFSLTVLDGRGAVLDWAPVERAAGLALERWPDLDPESSWKLGLARAIAGRHRANRGDVALPAEAWLVRLPMPIRAAVLAHLVQNCADCGSPPAAAVLTLAERAVPSCLRESSNEQLRLCGARARLLAVVGHPEQALALQKAIAEELLERFQSEDVTFQVSEWLRLAAALGETQEFCDADEWLKRHVARRQVDHLGWRYVDLARARGQVALGIDASEGRKALQGLCTDAALPLDVRCSAARCLLRATPCSTESQAREAERLLCDAVADPEKREVAQPFRVLCDLDRAVAAGDRADADRALEALSSAVPGVVGHLRRSAERSKENVAEYVARFYPY